MTTRLHIFLLAIVSLLLSVVSAACSATHQEEPALPGALYQAGFYLSVGQVDDASGSRAPAGDYDPGSGYENYIDLSDNSNMRVVLYDLSDNFLGEITDFTITPLESYESSKRYYLNGTTDVDISSGKFKVLVLANWPSYPQQLSLANIWKVQYQYNSAPLSDSNLIPLFGIKAISIAGVEPGVAANLGTIHLLRALAKIEVILDDDSDFWHFSKLKLTHYNDRGYCAPTGISNQNQYVTDSWATDYVGYTSIPSDAKVNEGLDFVPAGNNTFVLYVPEYNNSRAGTPEAEIRIDFKESILGERSIVIRDSAGRRLDFNRNVWYKVKINKKDEQTEADITVDVIPYAVVDLDPIFGVCIDECRPNHP